MKSTAEIIAQSLRIAGLRERYRRIAARRSEHSKLGGGSLNLNVLRLLDRCALAALGDYMAAIDEK